jgi:hypothetical protein
VWQRTDDRTYWPRRKGAGLDISSELIKSFREKWPTCEALCASIDTQPPALAMA